MDVFLKALGGVLVALIIYLILSKQGKDISVILTIAVCVMVIWAAVEYMEPVIALVNRLQKIGKLDSQMLQILLKSVGITILTEIVGHICADSGNSSMEKTVRILSSGVILWLCVPLFTTLMDLVEEILVAI
jgi:stage III sporulation protein AD